MGQAVHVESIEALKDLDASLGRFVSEAHEALSAADLEIRRTLDWLQERLRHSQREVERWQREVQRAAVALERCRRSGYYDRDGRYHAPDCSAYEAALQLARQHLRAAKAERANARNWLGRVHEGEDAYRREARRLERMTSADIPRARALLKRKVADLRAYLAVSRVAAALAVGGIAVGAAIGLLRSLPGHFSNALGSQGEEIAAQLVAEEFALQELPFDQPHHGFDRVFAAPGIPVIVVESKVASDGELHLRPTKDGQQASAEWVAATAGRMADPRSAQRSPANERIAALVREIGPEHVPVLTVVVNPATELADVYYRSGASEEWRLLKEGLSLQDLGGGL